MPEISLLVGMTAREGMNRIAHQGFVKASQLRSTSFECRYVVEGSAVHSKVYAWTRDGQPIRGFIGSANYSQNAFGSAQREVLHEIDAVAAELYVHNLFSRGLDCETENIHELLTLHDMPFTDLGPLLNQPDIGSNWSDLPQQVSLPLFTDRGEMRVPARSQLNWGQREGRNPNQAYLKIPIELHRTGFFPELGIHFTLLTDDGEVFDCVRAQEWGKALETPESNALLGEYFRRRIGVASGAPVELEDLQKYGRTDVTIFRTSNSEYKLDFSVN